MSQKDPVVLSGMRPTGQLHLGHLYGVISQWTELQHQYKAFWCAADWHALTTHYQSPHHVPDDIFNMVVDWLACGIDTNFSHIFVQSHVPECAELFLLLSMVVPKNWLERVPTYKDCAKQFATHPDSDTYGFLGYPLLQAADILLYQADLVPVGEDQLPHIELAREVARRFNFLYGRSDDFEQSVQGILGRLGGLGEEFMRLSKLYRQEGLSQLLEEAKVLLEGLKNQLNRGDYELLRGYIEGECRIILTEPASIITKHPKVPGTDGRKMSKSYGNTITLRDTAEEVGQKIRGMPTDPARVRRHDPGDPQKCPVWSLHKLCTNDQVQSWVVAGCKKGSIGCLECKQTVVDAVVQTLEPIQTNVQQILENPEQVRSALEMGKEAASKHARDTLGMIKEVMSLDF